MQRLVGVVLFAACHGKTVVPNDRPVLTAALVSPALRGLVVGTSTYDDVTTVIKDHIVVRDKTLAGEGNVQYNGSPAIAVHGDGLETLLDNHEVLVRAEAGGKDLCGWVEKTFDALPGSHDCGAGKKAGKLGGKWLYCAAAGERTVDVECSSLDRGEDSLSYSLGK